MNPTSAGGYVDFSRFGQMRAEAHSNAEAALQDVGDEFEAMFLDLMLKAARQAGLGEGMFDSSALDTYHEMFDQQLAITMARTQNLGIGDAISRQFGDPAKREGDPAAATPRDPMRSVETPFSWPVPPRQTAQAPHPERTVAAGGNTDGNTDKHSFVAMMTPHATAAAEALGLAPRALIAQAALESGWGRHVIRRSDGSSSHNYFGIKAGPEWPGATVNVPTTEYIGGRAVTVNAAFRAYPNAGAAFSDYIDFIGQNPRYRGVLAHGANEAQFAQQLEAAGYATDPDYANKIMAILSGDDWQAELSPARQVSN